MKKLIALLMVCGFAFAFVACGGGKTEEAAASDTTATTPAVEQADTTANDTTATDTTAAQ
ncbi:MAG TPA: hypothetical protein VGD65_23405 [Chryseosolibacter sp.]